MLSSTSISNASYKGADSERYQQTGFSPFPFFVSSLRVGADTGVLQALALRFNTSLICQKIGHSDYLATCDGDAPLVATYSNADRPEANAEDTAYPIFTFRACVPGNFDWVADTNGNSQETTEVLYVDLQSSKSDAERMYFNGAASGPEILIVFDFSYHCTSISTMAHYKSPNYWNGHQVRDIVDLGNAASNVSGPTGSNLKGQHGDLKKPVKSLGPLQTSSLVLFGNNSFFDLITNANEIHDANLEICEAFRKPLTALCTGSPSMCNPYIFAKDAPGAVLDCLMPGVRDPATSDPDAQHPNGTLAFNLYMLLQRFNNLNSPMAALTLTNFYSSQAMLDPTKALSDTEFQASREPVTFTIYFSPGISV